MTDLTQLQKEIFANKVAKGFNTTDVPTEFCLIQTELAEALQAYWKKLPTVGEELADVAIYLFGLAEMFQVDLGEEILKKVERNKQREYARINGVLTRTKDVEPPS